MAEPKIDLLVSPEEERKIEERTSIGAVVVNEAIRAEGEAELQRSTLSGNIIGGVSLVAALNHAQVVAGAKRN